MKVQIKLFGRRLAIDFGLKAPEFVSAKEVREFAEVDKLSNNLIKINRRLVTLAKHYNTTELYVKDLTEQDVDFLKSKGFKVRLRTKSVKGNQVVMMNHYIVKA